MWSTLAGALPALVARPRLWSTAWRVGLGLVPTRWWARWPPLPLPDRDWLAFRLETAFGSPEVVPEPAELVDWLEWCRAARVRDRYRLAGRRLR